jgi:hypothetical protein
MAGFCIVLLMGVFSSVILFFIILFLIYLLLCLFNYIMESLAIYRMCKNNNYKHPILAWIPYYNRVLLGDFAESKKMGYITFISHILTLFLVIFTCYFLDSNSLNNSGIVNFINCSTSVLAIIIYVLNIIMVHRIMKKTIPKAADLLTVLNIFTFGISRCIVLFALRNRKELIKQEL